MKLKYTKKQHNFVKVQLKKCLVNLFVRARVFFSFAHCWKNALAWAQLIPILLDM